MSGSVHAHRQDFYQQISRHNLVPLWERPHPPQTPISPAKPAHWGYDDVVRPFMMQSADLITAKEADRRVLVLQNPGLEGQYRVTNSLFAGLQLIMPGEVAPAHRHTPSALRFIVEGEGAYTAVEGERTAMRPGDFVVTPSWAWHDHGNETDRPMVWLDGLDTPLVRLLDAGFAEGANADSQAIARPEGDSLARFGTNMVPVDWKPERRSSPVFNYPYARSREALHTLSRNGDPDACHGYKLRYIDPTSGGSPMPTIGTFMALLPGGFAASPYRSTDGTLYSVVEGTGETIVGGVTIRWKPRDLFVVPSWHWHHHRAISDAVLFSFSDRPVQQALSLWREERLDQ
jgi:gentisate 1,2-dioxygenase